MQPFSKKKVLLIKTKEGKMRQLKISKQITRRETASFDRYLNDISKLELLKPSEEADLAARIKEGDMKAFNTLINANLRFVVSVAKQYQNQGLSLPDLINEGNIGLIKAANRFDATKGFKFISYAVWWIRQAILQALAEHSRIVRLPLNKVGSVNKINKAFTKLLQLYEREPTTEELAKELDMLTKDVKDAIRNSEDILSVDTPISKHEDNNIKLLDIISSNNYHDFLNASLKEEIERILNTFYYRDAEIIRLYYGIDKDHKYTLEEIGEIFNLTRERVRQIKGRTMRSLRRKSNCLKSFL